VDAPLCALVVAASPAAAGELTRVLAGAGLAVGCRRVADAKELAAALQRPAMEMTGTSRSPRRTPSITGPASSPPPGAQTTRSHRQSCALLQGAGTDPAAVARLRAALAAAARSARRC
jgi:hypothetical protein